MREMKGQKEYQKGAVGLLLLNYLCKSNVIFPWFQNDSQNVSKQEIFFENLK